MTKIQDKLTKKILDKLFCYINHVLKIAQLKPGELLSTRQTSVLVAQW